LEQQEGYRLEECCERSGLEMRRESCPQRAANGH
jgi:hypothetical protein